MLQTWLFSIPCDENKRTQKIKVESQTAQFDSKFENFFSAQMVHTFLYKI